MMDGLVGEGKGLIFPGRRENIYSPTAWNILYVFSLGLLIEFSSNFLVARSWRFFSASSAKNSCPRPVYTYCILITLFGLVFWNSFIWRKARISSCDIFCKLWNVFKIGIYCKTVSVRPHTSLICPFIKKNLLNWEPLFSTDSRKTPLPAQNMLITPGPVYLVPVAPPLPCFYLR